MSTTGLRIVVNADTDDAVRDIKKVPAAIGAIDPAADKAARRTELLGRAAAVSKVGLLALGLGAVKSTQAAADLGEQINKTNVVFGASAPEVQAWSKTTATSIGLSRRAALEAAGTFGNMLVPMGLARDEAAKMSQRMVDLAGDMASFNNASPEATLDALRAGLAGETEPLRQFGVFLNDARIKAEAMALGLYNGKGAIDASAKAQATYAIILKDTKDAQGDFANTSSSMANSQRVLRAQVENLAAGLGSALLPAATKVAGALTDLVGIGQRHQTVLKFTAAAAGGLALAILGVATAMKAATVAQAAFASTLLTNPISLFVAGVGLAVGAIIGLNSATGGGVGAMQRYRDAIQEAKGALDRLRDAALGVQQADLAHKGAILEVKAAQQGLREVQGQVRDGNIKGRDATLALEQAELRLKQAKLNVRQASRDQTSAQRAERDETTKANTEIYSAIRAARERVKQAELGVRLTRGSAEATRRLRDAERDLAAAQKLASDNADRLTSKVDASRGPISNMASETLKLRGKVADAAGRVSTLSANLRDFANSAGPGAAAAARDVGAGMGDGLIAGIVSRTGAVIAAAGRLASLATDAMARAANVRSPSKVTMKIGEELGNGLAAGVQRTSAKVKTVLTKAVRDAIASARQNATTLAGNLASAIGTAIDAVLGKRMKELGNSPEAQRIRAIEAQQKATQTAEERAGLQSAIDTATTPAERQAAQKAMDAWLLEQERQTLEESLAEKERVLAEEAEKRKTAAERGLADLTSALNSGLITQAQYNVGLQSILTSSGVDYGNIGALLGTAFATGFAEQVTTLLTQARVIAKGPKATVPKPKTAKKKIALPRRPDMPVYHEGIDRVPRTGPAVLQAGETVLDRRTAADYRAGQLGAGRLDVNVHLSGGLQRLTDLIQVTVDEMAEGARRRGLAAGAVR
jgi:hypothetical protein